MYIWTCLSQQYILFLDKFKLNLCNLCIRDTTDIGLVNCYVVEYPYTKREDSDPTCFGTLDEKRGKLWKHKICLYLDSGEILYRVRSETLRAGVTEGQLVPSVVVCPSVSTWQRRVEPKGSVLHVACLWGVDYASSTSPGVEPTTTLHRLEPEFSGQETKHLS